MSTIVGIKFKENGKVYYFDPQNIVFEKGDGAIVETARGTEYGDVEIPNAEVDESEIKGELKKVIRKATEKDAAQRRANLEKRPSYLREAQELANKRGLDIKIADVEFTFDGTKVIFYFTSDNRVDFRELVKDMASKFHMRIELRQIGIRDECKMKGEFSERFARFITENNAEEIVRQMNRASIDIAGNANGKIVNFDFAIKMILLIKNF